MNILSIETSGREGSLAVRSDGETVGERSLSQTGRRHAQTLVSELDGLLQECRRDYRDLEAVAVSIGPGSFTGLRVGVACAKTLAWATGCRLAAVDTLQAIAQNAPADVEDLHVVSDAQRGELFVGRYLRDSEGWFVRKGEIETVTAGAWCAGRPPGAVVTGPGLDRYAGDISARVRLLEPAERLPAAAVVAELGERQVSAGETADVWLLEPIYIRKSAAEEKRDAAAASYESFQ